MRRIIRLFREERFNLASAEVQEDCVALRSFLESDIQSSVALCDRVLAFVQETRSGNPPEDDLTGNSSSVTIGIDRVRIENNYAIPEERCEMSLDEFEEAVREWRAFIAVD
jgi:hypothetical protein